MFLVQCKRHSSNCAQGDIDFFNGVNFRILKKNKKDYFYECLPACMEVHSMCVPGACGDQKVVLVPSNWS